MTGLFAQTAELNEAFRDVIGWAKWIGYLVCALALIAAAIRLAVAQQTGGHLSDDGLASVLRPIAGAVLIGLAPTIIDWLL